MNTDIKVSGSLVFPEGAPARAGEIVNNIEEVRDIPAPRVGMIVYDKSTGLNYIIRSLKEKVIDGIRVDNAQVDEYELYDIATETARATAAEQKNAAAITLETERAQRAEQANADDIATETARATAAEQKNAAAITFETERAQRAEQANAAAIAAETKRATAAEQANAAAIAAERERATAAEQKNADAIAAERERATAAEQKMAQKISDLSYEIADNVMTSDYMSKFQSLSIDTGNYTLSFHTIVGTNPYGRFFLKKNYNYRFVFEETGYSSPLYKALKSFLDDSTLVDTTTGGEFLYKPTEDVEAYLTLYSGSEGGVTVTVTSLPVLQKEIADNLAFEAMPVLPAVVRSKYTKYDDGVPTGSGSYFTQYVYDVAAFVGRAVKVDSYSSNTAIAAVAFYSSGAISADTYLKESSVQSSGGYDVVDVIIPEGAVMMVVTHRNVDDFTKPVVLMKGLVEKPCSSAANKDSIDALANIGGVVLSSSYIRGYYNTNTGTLADTSSTTTAVSEMFIAVEADTEYVVKNIEGYKLAVYFYNAEKGFVKNKKWFSDGNSFVTESDTAYVRIALRKDGIVLSEIPDAIIAGDDKSVYSALNAKGIFKEGVKVSILGDSLSTFNGYIPASNVVYYPAGDVNAVYKTWWHQVIDAIGGVLDTNESCAGSSISTIRTDRPTFVSRCTNLGNPDVIFVHGGTNDISYNAPLGAFDASVDIEVLDVDTFCGACDKMVRLLKTTYPNATIIGVVPKTAKTAYSDALRSIYGYYDIKYIDLTELPVSLASNHYTAYGMMQVSGCVMRGITNEQKSEISNDVATPIYVLSKGGRVTYEDGSFVTAGAYWKYAKVDVRGLKDIEVTGNWYDGVVAAIAFYTDDGVYLKDTSVAGSKGESTKSAAIPTNAAYAICCSAELTPVIRTHSIGAVVSAIPTKLIDPLRALYNPFIGKPLYHHLNQEQVSAIPAQSLYDIAYAKALGFQVIEANVHKCADGVYVTKHGSSGKLGAGLVFAEGCGITADTAFGSVTSADLRTYVTYDTPLPQYAGHIPTLDEFCAECKRLGMMILLRVMNDNASLDVARKYLTDSEIILCGANERGDFTGVVANFQDVDDSTTVESVLNICDSFGKPYVFGGFWSSSMSDDKVREIVTALHKNGYLAGAAYADTLAIRRLAGLGVDMFASMADVNLFDTGNVNNVFSFDKFDVEFGNATLENGVANMSQGAVLSLSDTAFENNHGKVLVSLLFDGELNVQLGNIKTYTVASDGTAWVTMARVIGRSSKVIGFEAKTDTIIKGVKVLSSVVM